MKLKRLEDQVIVITGASSGIGLVTAQQAARRGAKVVLAARNEDALSKVTADINAHGGHAVHVVADVGREEDVRHIAEIAQRTYGGFDTWVNNAGISIYGPTLEVDPVDERRLFETTYWGVVYGCRVAVEYLRRRGGGAIINTGSLASDRAIPLQGAYSAAKHAVKGYTDTLRMELEHDREPISVTLIKPGFVDTAFIRHAGNYMPVQPKYGSPVYGPEAVADAILHAAAHPVRDLVVGGSSKLMQILGTLAPRSTDRVMEYTAFDVQQSDRPDTDPDSLYVPEHGPEAHSGQRRPFKRSLYTEAMMHRGVTTAVLVGAGALAAGAMWRRGQR